MKNKTHDIEILKEVVFDYLMYVNFSDRKATSCEDMLNIAISAGNWTDYDAVVAWANSFNKQYSAYRNLLQQGITEITVDESVKNEFDLFFTNAYGPNFVDHFPDYKKRVWEQWRFQALHNIFAAIGDRLPIYEIGPMRSCALGIGLGVAMKDEALERAAKSILADLIKEGAEEIGKTAAAV